jgi:hypothetical protein
MFRSKVNGNGIVIAVVIYAVIWVSATPVNATAAQDVTAVRVRVDGGEKDAARMRDALRERGARQGIAVSDSQDAYELRIIVLAREPQWQQVVGVSASGAVAVLDPSGELLFMHIRQKESSTGRATNRMADQILEHLPALLRGERLLEP